MMEIVRPINPREECLIVVDYRLSRTSWCARALYRTGQGFEIDIFKDKRRVAVCDKTYPTAGEGNRDVAAICAVLDAAIKQIPYGNLIYLE